MSVRIIRPGDLLRLGVREVRVIAFDWRSSFHAGVTITLSTWTITAVTQADALADLTSDNGDILTAAEATIALEETVTAESLVTVVRLIGTTATLGDEYIVANTVVSSESPTQTKEQSIRVLIENR
jgi:hypothetical protein